MSPAKPRLLIRHPSDTLDSPKIPTSTLASYNRESDPREEDVEVSALCNELLADNNDGLNTVGDGDNEPQHGAVKSNDEAEKNGIETGEFDLDEDMEPQCAPDDDHDDPTAEVRFGENVLSQFGDKDEDLAGNLKTQVLREISAIGWEDVAPSRLAFDKAVVSSRSSFNKMGVCMKVKPHKWGTKLFMLCNAVSAYCIRLEVYCGKKQHASDDHKPAG
ncbi:hypothetical protein PR002_g19444 [Phytophthora rubi]|uniref:PiggyBac transposable element-derived protein domain-containing protein n=1 Tax=Phytophthora rubi TaxID=129364 RepID=A0A6A3JWI4_9STRA|nr:hypothetical protein PR002_g19444 [Phytophthora rubi]